MFTRSGRQPAPIRSTPMNRRPRESWIVDCEFGPGALAARSGRFDVIVVVDVLSFSTCVEIAVSREATVFPFPSKRDGAAAFALETGAELAGPREEAGLSLSPRSFLQIPEGARVVLPSPNGAALSIAARARWVLTGCLRNAGAVARAANEAGGRVLVVPAGERWPNGSLRPCLEDWWGAGAIVEALAGERSPEAEAAASAFRAVVDGPLTALRGSISGRELIARGYEEDVRLAAELNVGEAVPVFRNGAYRRLFPRGAAAAARDEAAPA
jgi:2-phosphosulfolactate phosphatase